jgi:hypothetical protein
MLAIILAVVLLMPAAQAPAQTEPGQGHPDVLAGLYGEPPAPDPGPHTPLVEATHLVASRQMGEPMERDRVFDGARFMSETFHHGLFWDVPRQVASASPEKCRADCEKSTGCVAWDSRPSSPFGPWDSRVDIWCRLYARLPPRTTNVLVVQTANPQAPIQYNCFQRMAPRCDYGVFSRRLSPLISNSQGPPAS